VTPTGNISGSTGSTTLTTQQIPSHSHAGVTTPMSGGPVACEQNLGRGSGSTQNTGGGSSHDHTLSANFVGSSVSTLQPYLVLVYIIKT
jgi:microcystin-dependent protein